MRAINLSMEEKIQIANRIRNVREKMGYTQESFAAFVGISLSAYKKIEECKNNVSVKTLFKLHEKGVSSDYILFGDEPDKADVWKKIDECNQADKISFLMRLYLYMNGVENKSQLKFDTAEDLFELLNDLLEENER